MKHLQIFLSIAITSALCGCEDNGHVYDSVINELDHTIDNQNAIYTFKEARIDSLRVKLAATRNLHSRYDIAQALFDEYSLYDTDSAFVYANLLRDIAAMTGDSGMAIESALNIANRYRVSGMFEDAIEILESLDINGIPEKLRFNYYNVLERIYHDLCHASRDPIAAKKHSEKAHSYGSICSQLRATASKREMLMGIVADTLYSGHPQAARELLSGFKDFNEDDYEFLASFHFWMAKAYGMELDKENEILHSALSAIYDRNIPVKASRSLINLAKNLLETGDTDHAFKYIVTAYDDAIHADAKIALMEIGRFQSEVISAYEKIQRHDNRILKYLLVSSLIFLLFLILGISATIVDKKKILKMQRKIQQSNDEIIKVNSELEQRITQIKEGDRIKDTYIGHYLMMFSKHIGSLEHYRSWLRIEAKSGDMQQMQQALRSEDPIDREREAIFKEFDETFLTLFPNFVEQLNSLLKNDYRIGQNVKPGTLSNELRIFALIRLGVSDSQSIAQFLKKSLSTIYNYRVKLRNCAKDRDEFEKDLMKIGTLEDAI